MVRKRCINHPEKGAKAFQLCEACYRRKYRKENPNDNKRGYKRNQRPYQLRKKYGITEEQYAVMFNNQKGLCWLCETPPRIIRLAVDHDHKTGMVRGLLCASCNFFVGMVERRVDFILRVLTWIGIRV